MEDIEFDWYCICDGKLRHYKLPFIAAAKKICLNNYEYYFIDKEVYDELKNTDEDTIKLYVEVIKYEFE